MRRDLDDPAAEEYRRAIGDYASPYGTAAPAEQPRPDAWVLDRVREGATDETLLTTLEGAGWHRLDAWNAIELARDTVRAQTAAPAFASSPVQEIAPGSLPFALLVGAGAGLAGGLLWAGIVIATHIGFGLVAVLVGYVTGQAVVILAGGAVPQGARIFAGASAAGGIMLGKYVIFVHELKHVVSAFAGSTAAARVHYLDSGTIRLFFHHFSDVVSPIYIVWTAFAFMAAYRFAGGRSVLRRRSA